MGVYISVVFETSRPYTVLLVGTSTRSWNTISFMLVSASESATSFAWYSRTPRMRRGPSTNICTPAKTWRAPWSTWVPIKFEPYKNDQQLLQANVSDRSAHKEFWRVATKLEARDTKKTGMCGIWAKRWPEPHYKLTLQNKTREILLALWNSPRWSILSMGRVVAGHKNVSQWPRLQDTARQPPKRCWGSKSSRPEAGHSPHIHKCTQTCQRVSAPLAFVPWALFFKSTGKTYPLPYPWLVLRRLFRRRC